MLDDTQEDKQEANENMSMDDMIDEYESQEQETPEESSTSEETKEAETDESESSEGTDLDKKSDDEEEEAEIPEKYSDDPAWQRIMKQRNEARDALKAKEETAIPTEEMEKFNKTISSPEYIQQSMKAQGYTQEKINAELKAKGFDVPDEGAQKSNFDYVLDKLGVKMDQLDDNGKNYVNTEIADVVRVAEVLIEKKLNEFMPGVLKPLQDDVAGIKGSSSGKSLMASIKNTITDEGILDFKADIEPSLHKFLNENSDATQEDIKEYFTTLNHKLSIERLKTGKRREKRNEAKKGLRSGGEGAGGDSGMPKPTGNSDKDIDAQMNYMESQGAKF